MFLNPQIHFKIGTTMCPQKYWKNWLDVIPVIRTVRQCEQIFLSAEMAVQVKTLYIDAAISIFNLIVTSENIRLWRHL